MPRPPTVFAPAKRQKPAKDGRDSSAATPYLGTYDHLSVTPYVGTYDHLFAAKDGRKPQPDAKDPETLLQMLAEAAADIDRASAGRSAEFLIDEALQMLIAVGLMLTVASSRVPLGDDETPRHRCGAARDLIADAMRLLKPENKP